MWVKLGCTEKFLCVEECRLCGIEWAMWKIVCYVEYSGLCGIEWAMWSSVCYAD